VEQFLRRQNVQPKVISADTWPSNTKFWKLLLGESVVGRLGLWHFINRIYRTLRETHPDFGKAIALLQSSIYRIDEFDEAAVMQALSDGTLNGTKLSWAEINELRGTARWNRNYAKFLKKIIYPETVLLANLDRWFVKFKVTASEGKAPGQGRLNPANGQTLFTPETKVAIEEAKKKAQFILDVLTLEEIYQPVEAPTRAKHNLPSYRCARATESKLESFHADQAMFGNTGMATGLIDTINHAGLARHNSKIRWRLYMDLLSSAERDAIPFYFRRIVRHYDHSRLRLINQMARAAGVEHDVHQNVRPLPKDNGERFYGDYFLEWLEREKTAVHPDKNDRCQCGACAGNASCLPFEMAAATTTSAAMKTGLPQSINATATRTSNVPATAMNRALLPATMKTASAGTLLPTTTGVAMLSFPTMAPGLLQAPQPYPVFYPVYAPFQLPAHRLPFQYYYFPPLIVQPPVVGNARKRKRKPQVEESHCCKRYWKYHVLDKPEGSMGAPPHCMDCPVRKQRKRPNNGPKGPH
jgi:hypothetical protein